MKRIPISMPLELHKKAGEALEALRWLLDHKETPDSLRYSVDQSLYILAKPLTGDDSLYEAAQEILKKRPDLRMADIIPISFDQTEEDDDDEDIKSINRILP